MGKTGGACLAGDAVDRFHKILMDGDEMTKKRKGWRTAWKGKLEGYMATTFSSEHPFNTEAKLLAIDGGPETQWEQNYLEKTFPKVHGDQHYTLVKFPDLNHFLEYLLEV